MASLSEKLKRERELRGISLKQISDDTKIGVRFLEALEDDRLELIPGEFYRRSYLRAYARYLGLDEDRAVNAFAFSQKTHEKEHDEDREPVPSSRVPWVLAVVGIAIVAMILLLAQKVGNPAVEVSQVGPGAVSPPGGVATAAASTLSDPSADPEMPAIPAPAADDVPLLSPSSLSSPSDPRGTPDTSGASGSSGPEEPNRRRAHGNGALRVVVAVGEACWLEIEADGEVVVTGLKEQGFRYALSADREVRLWLGNAGGVSLWVNDRPVRSLGRPGQVRRDLSITPENYTDFLSAAPGPS